jgi:hypothetical protein
MAHCFIMDFEGANAAQYDAVIDEGLVFHVNGPLDDGWATVGYWTSKAARDRFIHERVLPAMAGSAGPPAIEDLELHNSLTEAAVGTAA